MPIVSKPSPASLPPSGTAGGDLGGTYPNPTTDLNTGGGTMAGQVTIVTDSGTAQLKAKFTGASQTGFTVSTGDASSSVTVSADGTGKAQLDLIEDSNDGEVYFSTNNSSIVMPRTGFTGSILAVGIGGVKKLEASSVGLGFFAATPAAQPTAVADAAGGVVIDAEARAALNALLARVRTLGLIAT